MRYLSLPGGVIPLFVNNKFIELQPGFYFVCTRPDLASLVPSAQTPLHLLHLYHQVVEFSRASLPIGWTNSPRIWTSVMSVVAATLHRHGIRTLLYVDDLLIVYSSFEEASRSRQIIEDTLLTVVIVRVPLKGCFVTRVPERRCFTLCRQTRALLFETAKNRHLVDSDLLRRSRGQSSLACQHFRLFAFISQKSFNTQAEYNPRSFLSQAAFDNLLFWRNFSDKSPENLQKLWPDQPSTAPYTDASGTADWGYVLEPPHESTRSSAGWCRRKRCSK
jgi:hypothetical protein